MMRYLFLTLLGFFGPALLMIFVRLLWNHVKMRWFTPQQKVEIIDITPIQDKKVSSWLIVIWLALSVACTAFLIHQMDEPKNTSTTYIPAHLDSTGKLVPAQHISQEEKEE